MNELRKALDNFWDWAQISENDYLFGKPSPKAKQAEWEEDYPKWKQIEEEFDYAIDDLNSNWSEALSDLMIIAIALDNEDGLLIEQCCQRLTDLKRFVTRCVGSNYEYVRLEIALKINDLPLTHDLVEKLINDKSEIVRKIAKEKKLNNPCA